MLVVPIKAQKPQWGGVLCTELSRHHELTVFVEEEKFKDDIERWLLGNENYSTVNFIFVRKRRGRLLRKLWPPSYYYFYREWHQNVFNMAKQLVDEEEYDLCHQLTMCGFREPGFFSELGIPFVWGPIGSMGYFPKNFLRHVGPKGLLYHSAYNIYNFFHMRFLTRPKRSARRAGVGLLAATSENKKLIKRFWGLESTVITEIGLPSITGTQCSRIRPAGEPIRIVWSDYIYRARRLTWQ